MNEAVLLDSGYVLDCRSVFWGLQKPEWETGYHA